MSKTSTAPTTRPWDVAGAGGASRTTDLRVHSGQRLLLVTDGITGRHTESGVFGLEGIQRALDSLQCPTAAATAMAILHAVSDCWKEPLEDDGTVVVLCVS